MSECWFACVLVIGGMVFIFRKVYVGMIDHLFVGEIVWEKLVWMSGVEF